MGAARTKEVDWKDLKPKMRRMFYEAMRTEWAKWQAWKATRNLTPEDLAKCLPDLRMVSTRCVLAYCSNGQARARLVIQGCQERTDHIRGDAPTATRDAMMVVFAYGSQSD